jgi:hypothetical protein
VGEAWKCLNYLPLRTIIASMSRTAQDILREIEQLPEEERLILEERLSQRAEEQWREEVVIARQRALERGIDQAAIDDAVRRIRNGK